VRGRACTALLDSYIWTAIEWMCAYQGDQ
jgi:hypothetical protein